MAVPDVGDVAELEPVQQPPRVSVGEHETEVGVAVEHASHDQREHDVGHRRRESGAIPLDGALATWGPSPQCTLTGTFMPLAASQNGSSAGSAALAAPLGHPSSNAPRSPSSITARFSSATATSGPLVEGILATPSRRSGACAQNSAIQSLYARDARELELGVVDCLDRVPEVGRRIEDLGVDAVGVLRLDPLGRIVEAGHHVGERDGAAPPPARRRGADPVAACAGSGTGSPPATIQASPPSSRTTATETPPFERSTAGFTPPNFAARAAPRAPIDRLRPADRLRAAALCGAASTEPDKRASPSGLREVRTNIEHFARLGKRFVGQKLSPYPSADLPSLLPLSLSKRREKGRG